MQLIPEISQQAGLLNKGKRAWKLWSVRLATLLTLAAALYAELPALKQYLPREVFPYVVSILGILVIIARIIKQDAGASASQNTAPPEQKEKP